MLTFPPRIFLYTDSLMPCAAPRGSLFMAPRAADTNSGLTSIRALRMSFCKAFWVLGFVDRADSNIFRCSMITASFASNWNIHYSDHSPPGVYCTRKSRPAHHCEGRRKLKQFTMRSIYSKCAITLRIGRPPRFGGLPVHPISGRRCSPSAGIALASATWAFLSQ